MLSSDEVLAQSKGALAQWGATWTKHATINGELFQKLGHSHRELMFKGAGKTCLCVAMGPSLEDQIEIVKEHQDNPAVDIFCVDKAFGMLIDNGVKPENINYLNVADAGIDYDRWLKPWVEHTVHTNLISNITANIAYVKEWKINEEKNNVWFYVNKDNINTQDEYMRLSGCQDLIPAGSNVGNSVVIFATSVLGYSEVILLGYDFAWQYEDNYYAFCDAKEIGTNKRGWMRHIALIDKEGKITNTSQNLMFSARWLSDFYNIELKNFGIKMYDCSGKGVLFGIPDASLSRKLELAKQEPITQEQKDVIFNSIMHKQTISPAQGDQALNEIFKNNNVINLDVRYITKEQDEFLKAI